MPNIPNCSNCEDEGTLKAFKGFYQECFGKRRSINLDGSLDEYQQRPDASQSKVIKCIACGAKPEPHKIHLWASKYGWSWPETPPQVPFDAKKIAEKLEQFYKKRGSDVIRISIKKSDIKYVEFPKRLDPKVITLVKKSGKDRLYSYQADAINSIFDNRVTVVQAPTGAGKSLIYQILYLDSLLKNKTSRLLALFPTQALTKDQARAFVKLSQNSDGDPIIPQLLTSSEYQFESIKDPVQLALFCGKDSEAGMPHAVQALLKKLKNIHVLFGTPDKLYVHLYKEQFRQFLKELELIVMDEAHMATGIFGGNCAYLIRRMLKLAPKAKLLIMSATFNSVRAFTEVLSGEQVALVDGSNTIKNNRELLLVPLWPHKKRTKDGSTVEPATAVLDTVAQIVQHNDDKVPPGIVFGRSRRGLSFLLRLMEKRIKEGEYPKSLGILPKVFKRDLAADIKDDLLKQIHNREISIMMSTNALELGIDIGGIDFVILESLPDSNLSFLQRIGRSGRSRDGLAIVFIEKDPYQQYWLQRVAKSKKIDLDDVKPLPIAISNPNIIKNNYIRYAWEAKTHLGINIAEVKKTVNGWSGDKIDRILSQFKDSKELSDIVYIEKLIKDPITNNLVAMRVAINVEDITIIERTSNKKKGSIGLSNFFRDLHEHAVWTDENGTPFRVVDYDDYDSKSRFPKIAIVVSEKNKDRRTYGVVKIKQTEMIDGLPPKDLVNGKGYFIKYGPFKIEEKSPGYYESISEKTKFIPYNQDPDSKMKISRPKYETMGLIIHNDSWKNEKPSDTDRAILFGFLTLFRSIASHHVGASEEDIQYDFSDSNGSIYILDSSAGGNGVSEQIARDLNKILTICLSIAKACKCKNGCFNCIWPQHTDIKYEDYSKKDTIKTIEWLLGVSKNVNI